jgi:hypothetical protein
MRRTAFLLFAFGLAAAPVFSAPENRAVPTDRPVSYEAFGAVGDGVAV